MKFRSIAAALAAAVVVGALPRVAAAQYFGRNKVQYKKLDFQILKTEHFDIYYYPEEREGIDIAARMAERWRVRLGRLLGHELRGRQPLILYASHPEFEQTNAIYGEISEGTGGVTEPLRRRIVLPLGGPLADTDHVIGHELVHAYQFDITTNPNAPAGQNGAQQLPLWFIEGMAEYFSVGPVDPNTAMWLRDAVRAQDPKTGKDALPSIEQLDNPKYFPYRWGQAFWAYVGGRFGDDKIRQMLAFASASGDTNVAIERVLGVKTKELSDDWHAAIRAMYEPFLASTTPPNEMGRLIIKSEGLGGDLNVGPSLSPDGKWLAFLSTRSVFSTDLFIADAQTGRIAHRLTSTATDPHFNSIQFIYSAGGWDAESRRIAIATVVSGYPALAIFDAVSGDRQREVPLEDLDEIFNPAFAPDGNAVAFTGMTRGLTDLYVYDLAGSKLRRMTNDAFADLQPAWSPDGRTIAIATDRFSSNLPTLAIGDYRLGLVDLASGDIRPVRAFTTGKNINPQWTPDGRALLFISDRDGIPNVYRVGIDSGDIAQVTRVGTGISGITASSPALSMSSTTGVAAFSVYEGGKYDIYSLELGTAAAMRANTALTSAADANAPTLSEVSATAGALPPAQRPRSEVYALLHNASLGLPPPATATQYATEKYRGGLKLDRIAQPTVAVGTSRFGAAIAGGIALQFSDMLGDQSLLTAVQVNSGISNSFSFKNTAAQAVYFNQAHRWNWGIIGGQVPYLSGGYLSGLTTANGEAVRIDKNIIYRQTELSAAGVVAYPFNRAHRLEFQSGVTRISFDQIVQTVAYGLNTGNLYQNDSVTTSLGAPLTLANTSGALVYDTSNFGATSPVAGQRWRLEAAPTVGSINFTSVLADYRRYFMPVSFYTIAVRGMHYGRYGSGGEDARLFPLFLGYPNLVRGYSIGNFTAADCTPSATSSCVEFDRLLGSRLALANVEFRFPLLRPFGATQRMYGPVPIEVAFFADAGVAWNRGQRPTFNTSAALDERTGVSSAGVAFRVNLFGYAIGQFDFARPFQRPNAGWVFQFNLSPGF